ncbi:MAG: AprI/Inh family metalloprotease inhibitor [Rhizobiales bacterium]|nr:protease inhibitor Inh/omp19 family protein [Hyphomicrobiales bacterium]NRB12791.1 AprI/Inh family metalloprotease inhibitor [Hyphomicrobiales bacterium]
MNKLIASVAIASLLAACNTTGTTNTSGSGKKTVWQNGQSNTTVEYTNNGKTTTTTSSSANITVDENALGGLFGALFGIEPVKRQDIVGNWRFYQVSSNQTCNLELSDTPSFGHYKAKIGFGCGTAVFHTKAWDLVKDDVVVFDAFGKIIVRLKRVNNNRWDGTTIINGAVVTLTK